MTRKYDDPKYQDEQQRLSLEKDFRDMSHEKLVSFALKQWDYQGEYHKGMERVRRLTWIPVSEQLPDIGSVLVWVPEISQVLVGWYNPTVKSWVPSGRKEPFACAPTHWMQLPRPPE